MSSDNAGTGLRRLAGSTRPWLDRVPMPGEAISNVANEFGGRTAKGEQLAISGLGLSAHAGGGRGAGNLSGRRAPVGHDRGIPGPADDGHTRLYSGRPGRGNEGAGARGARR
jgi:hypothetical protein